MEQNLWLSQSDGKAGKKSSRPTKSWGSRKHENAILGGKANPYRTEMIGLSAACPRIGCVLSAGGKHYAKLLKNSYRSP